MPISLYNEPTRIFPWRDAEYYGDTLVYGQNEVKSDKERCFEQPGYASSYRRGKYWSHPKTYDSVRATHDWLSKNIQSPWFLEYTYGALNDDDKVCWVHIERYDERKKFEKSKCAKDFGGWADDSSALGRELHDLAVIKGLVTPYSIKEDFLAWDAENTILFKDGHKNGKKTIQLKSKHPAVLKSFEENILSMELFTLNDQGVYVCDGKLYEQNKNALRRWGKAVSPALIEEGDRKAGDPRFNRVKLRYDDTRAEFLEYWGEYFKYDAKEDVYYNGLGDIPRVYGRELPPEFLSYMNGIAPDPSLKPA